MFKHTPGPWNSGRTTSGSYRVSDASQLWVVAYVEKQHDVQLITTAPLLLAVSMATRNELLAHKHTFASSEYAQTVLNTLIQDLERVIEEASK